MHDPVAQAPWSGGRSSAKPPGRAGCGSAEPRGGLGDGSAGPRGVLGVWFRGACWVRFRRTPGAGWEWSGGPAGPVGTVPRNRGADWDGSAEPPADWSPLGGAVGVARKHTTRNAAGWSHREAPASAGLLQGRRTPAVRSGTARAVTITVGKRGQAPTWLYGGPSGVGIPAPPQRPDRTRSDRPGPARVPRPVGQQVWPRTPWTGIERPRPAVTSGEGRCRG